LKRCFSQNGVIKKENLMKKQTYLIVELLRSFSEKEQKRFKQLVISPFFNSDEKVVELLGLILAYVNQQHC